MNYYSNIVWSVNILCGLLILMVSLIVIYILRLAHMETQDGTDDTTESKELLQFPSDRD
jgi:hypothetical protein